MKYLTLYPFPAITDCVSVRTKLQTCMTKFMDIPKLRFQDLSRTQRIACTKDLRTAMEDRMSSLLEVELQKSLNDIGYEA